MIDNTSRGAADAFLLESLITGNPGQVIEDQEARGQQQLVNSDRLPTDLRGERADWEALGFTFGEPDPEDPMFAPATLPDGWTKRGSDHAMWSYIDDELGRERIGIFYRASVYNRLAHASITAVHHYVYTASYYGRPVITDETWATPQAVHAAAEELIREADRRLEMYAVGTRTCDVRELSEARADRAKYQAIADSVRPT